MGSDIGIVSQCPHCQRADRIVRAVEVRLERSGAAGDGDGDGENGADIALPAYEWWSMLLIGAMALLMLGAASTLGAASANSGNFVAGGLMVAAMPLGLFGLILTSRNRTRMRAVEPDVRGYHEVALYCEHCERMHFRAGELPPGFDAQSAFTLAEYRRELWYACGFIKSGLLPR